MSKIIQNQSNKSRGASVSYLIGFGLSIAFSLIPYSLVVNQSNSSNALLAIILGFAVLQMIVQIFFFLHLGRGPKPLYNVVFFVSTVVVILVVIGGSLFIMKHLHYNMSPTEVARNRAEKEGIYQIGGQLTGACQHIGEKHQAVIDDNQINPTETRAQLCDSLTFIAQDDNLHEITFSSHPDHGTYGGEVELIVRPGRNKTITLNQTGSYQFHDHLNPNLTGNFTVGND